MEQIVSKERFIRSLPGRLRVEVYGLKANPSFAEKLQVLFQGEEGILTIRACTDTGRMLLTYNEKIISLQKICHFLHRLEEQEYIEQHPQWKKEIDDQTLEEVAAAVAIPVDEQSGVPETFQEIPVAKREKPESAPLILTASVIGLGVLGAKQVLYGKSPLARSPGMFYTSGILAMVTGYPILKKGFERFAREGRFNADLVLGAAAFGMALVHENIVALAGVSIIQFLDWQRKKNNVAGGDPALYLSAETKAYAERATKWAFGLAGMTYLVTRNPLQTMGVLLTANPRPSLAAEEYAWRQAELSAKQAGLTLPQNQTLCQLAQTEKIVIEDTSLLFTKQDEVLSCITEDSEEKVWCLARSLTEKTNHPLMFAIKARAEETRRTKRTAFHVEETEEGIKGIVNGQNVFFGSKKWMQRNNVCSHEYEDKAKRYEREGYTVYFLGRQDECIGIILYSSPFQAREEMYHIKSLREKFPSVQVSFLYDSIGVKKQPSLWEPSWELLPPGAFESLHYPPVKNVFIREQADFRKIEEAMVYSKKVDLLNKQHRKWNRLWNIIGTALVIPGRLAPPLANLITDACKLIMLARSKKLLDKQPSGKGLNPPRWVKNSHTWHAFSEEELAARLETNLNQGLSEEEVMKARSALGCNEIQPAEKRHWIFSLAKQFTEFTTLLLLGTAAVSVFSGDVFDGIAMSAVLFMNAVVSTIQERKAEQVVNELNQFQPPLCKVIRSGQEQEVSAIELVPGDVVVLEAGDCVPADIRMLSDWNFEVNEAPLTGESLAVRKTAGTQAADTPLAERSNLIYMGTNVTRGKGIGVVIGTGMNTEIGYLTALLKDGEKEQTLLQQQVTSISKLFVRGAIFAGTLVFAVGLLRGNTMRQMISTSVALIASAIPEGLPVTITIALSAGIYRMARRNAIVRKLSALETLGRVTVICTDKTGTLTKNEMTVTKVATVNETWAVTGNGYSIDGEFSHQENKGPLDNKDVHKLLHIGFLCNNSQLVEEQGVQTVKGDPTEGALLVAGAKAGLLLDDMSKWKRKREIPFDSNRGTMSVICHEEEDHESCFIMSKGSVETIVHRCASYEQNGRVYPLTEEIRTAILKQNDVFASQALRVLGFAYRPIQQDEAHEEAKEEQLIYIGMVGMIDPPKAEVAQAIEETFHLGVKPVMITGDHPVTAISIGRQLGIYREGDRVITGKELNEMSEEQLAAMIAHVSIFARVSPEHKLRIVQAYQNAGHIVAMTGDGVNDAPAIKKANVGIAMGKTGTEVTKQTADMVLKEDHFGSILDGVKEGRTIISNIRKAIGCLLTGNLAEILVSSVAVLAGLPIPLVPIQILLMNLLTDALPAAVLAVNPGNKELVTERQDIVDKNLYRKVAVRGLILGLAAVGVFAGGLATGASLPAARTMAFVTLVAGQLMQTFSWRQENGQQFSNWIKDRFFIGSLGISWLALLSVMYVPAFAQFFHTAPLSFVQLAQVLLVSGSVNLLSRPILKALTGERPSLSSYLISQLQAA
ncbi:cation-translocating P-type ATPase [Aneurinibacillus tyrosinisolvens]|uniref:cation-translocating P-type ATPase n=1 Tax=Aneurinibacillus tyrosinisolvens TaxID=1443435 RepID=UPI00063FA029|nr:HAD-IC family P-type ATPase [Aneurinibacillus tyrosinisolvens]